MQLHAIPLTAELVSFVDRVYEQNRAVLHGNIIPIEEWQGVFSKDADPYEVNFIIMADNQPAAWLKIHGLIKITPQFPCLLLKIHYAVGDGIVRPGYRFQRDFV